MPTAERQKFLSPRPVLGNAPDRMALAVAEQFCARERGDVRLVAGAVFRRNAQGDRVQMVVRKRGTDQTIELHADWVINCTGPAPSNSPASNPAIGSLLVHGWLRPDELGLGVETGADGNAIDAEGREVPDLFVVGTLRKPAFWESTAVPELRNQAAVVADRAVSTLTRRPPVPGPPNFVMLRLARHR